MNKKCEAGCKHFTGGEIRHHKDCVFYPESFSQMYDDLMAKEKSKLKYYLSHITYIFDPIGANFSTEITATQLVQASDKKKARVAVEADFKKQFGYDVLNIRIDDTIIGE